MRRFNLPWKGNGGVTLVEVLIALGLLAFGMIPVFMTFSETRRVTMGSINEMKATSMASSLIDGMRRVPVRLIDPQENSQITVGFFDEALPPELALASMGVPAAYPGLDRHVQVNLVNAPMLPGERFSNPWGRVVEIAVTVRLKPVQGQESGAGKTIYRLKGFREIGAGR